MHSVYLILHLAFTHFLDQKIKQHTIHLLSDYNLKLFMKQMEKSIESNL